GTVTSVLKDGRLEVEVGRLRMQVFPDQVKVILPGGADASQPSSHPSLQAQRTLTRPGAITARIASSRAAQGGESAQGLETYESPAEINVIGSTAEEARDQVDRFLDQAFLAGRPRIRVIHGHGKGILMRALHEMFASHPHVDKFYSAAPREGGTGATIV